MSVELPTPQDLAAAAQDAFRTGLDAAGAGTADLRAGSRLDVAVSVNAQLTARVGRYVADRVAAGRLESATVEDLDVHGIDLFQAPRKDANAATGLLRLTRGGSTATVIPVGSRFGKPASGTTPAVAFAATEDTPSSATSVVVPVACTEARDVGLVTPAQVTAILDPLPDTTWVLDTAFAGVIAGGTDRESDETYRARLRQTDPQTQRQRGTRAAVLSGTLAVPGVTFATVVEPLDGTLVVYAGDNNYLLSDAMTTAIQTALLEWRAFGVPTLVRPYAVTTVTVAGTIHMARDLVNYDQSALRAAAVAAVQDYFARRPHPDEYYVTAIEAALFRAHDEVQQVTLTLPSADVPRPADAGYGAVTALARYVVTPASIQLTLAQPLTT